MYLWIVREEYVGVLPVDRLLGFYAEAWRTTELANVGLYQEGVQILRAYAQSQPEIDHMAILDVEREFNIDVQGFTMNGYIDRVDKLGDEHIAIVDYKSNRMLFSQSELDADLQMSIYGLAARVLYPWAKEVSFVFHMLRHNVKQAAPRTVETIDDAAGYVAALGYRTETSKDFLAQLNPNCGYCDHRIRCGAYKDAIAGRSMILKATDMTDLTSVAAEREQVARLAKMMYARKEELDSILKKKLATDTDEMVLAGTIYKIQNAFTTTYEQEAVVRIFAGLGYKPEEVRARIAGVDKDKVEELRVEAAGKIDRAKGILLKASLEAIAQKKPLTPKLQAYPDKSSKKVSVAENGRGTTSAP